MHSSRENQRHDWISWPSGFMSNPCQFTWLPSWYYHIGCESNSVDIQQCTVRLCFWPSPWDASSPKERWAVWKQTLLRFPVVLVNRWVIKLTNAHWYGNGVCPPHHLLKEDGRLNQPQDFLSMPWLWDTCLLYCALAIKFYDNHDATSKWGSYL